MNITYKINSKKNGYQIYCNNNIVFVQSEPNIPYRFVTNNITNYQLSAETHIERLKETGYFLSLEEYKELKISEANAALSLYRKTHPIISSCHNNIPKYYDISDTTQSLLAGRIITASVNQSKQTETYYTSWMPYGEPCEYDWTLEDLQQLAAEMESFISPLATKLNTIILTISGCGSKGEVDDVEISF